MVIKKSRISRWRFLILTGAFLIILVNPFINYYLHVHFVQGWYQSIAFGKLWFVSPLEGLEALLITKIIYLPQTIAMLIPILVALFLGRVFCSWICPISFFYEIMERVHKKISKKSYFRRKDRVVLPRKMLWFVLIGEIVISMILAKPLFVFLSPPGLVGREIMMLVFFRTLAIEGIIIVLVLLSYFLSTRFFCRYLCPLGALLASLGTKRRLVIAHYQEICGECEICDEVCPLGLKPSKNESLSIYCWNCGNCVDICPIGARKFVWRELKLHMDPLKLPRIEIPGDKASIGGEQFKLKSE